MTKVRRFAFIGNDAVALSLLLREMPDGAFWGAICESERLTPELRTICAVAKGNLWQVDKREDLPTALSRISHVELIIICSFGWIVSSSELRQLQGNVVNVHFSLLPALKGRHPVEWAILKGVPVSGVTLHVVIADVDAGPIVAQAPYRLQALEDARSLRHALYQLLPELFARLTLAGTFEAARPQLPASGVLPRLTQQDARLNWANPVEANWRLVQSQVEHQGAWFLADGSRIHVTKAMFGAPVPELDPGTIISISGPHEITVQGVDAQALQVWTREDVSTLREGTVLT